MALNIHKKVATSPTNTILEPPTQRQRRCQINETNFNAIRFYYTIHNFFRNIGKIIEPAKLFYLNCIVNTTYLSCILSRSTLLELILILFTMSSIIGIMSHKQNYTYVR